MLGWWDSSLRCFSKWSLRDCEDVDGGRSGCEHAKQGERGVEMVCECMWFNVFGGDGVS